MTTNLLFGADPEMFSVYKEEGTEKLMALPPYYFRRVLGVPAKIEEDNPRHPIFIENRNYTLIEDGAAWEMTIPPSFSPAELFHSIQLCRKAGETKILSRFENECLPKFQFLPTVAFDVENRWKNMGEDFKVATEFGCDPDEDAYNLQVPARIIDASKIPERYSGGHVHISGSKFIEDEPILAVKCLHLTAGLASIKYTDVRELEKMRTFLYGKPGKHRIQRYGNNKFGKEYAVGIEYRTISSRWASNWRIAKEVFKWAEIGIRSLLERGLGLELLPELATPACDAILQADVEMSSTILEYIESKL